MLNHLANPIELRQKAAPTPRRVADNLSPRTGTSKEITVIHQSTLKRGVPVLGSRLTLKSEPTSKIVMRRYLSDRGVRLTPIESRVSQESRKVKKRPAKRYNR